MFYLIFCSFSAIWLGDAALKVSKLNILDSLYIFVDGEFIGSVVLLLAMLIILFRLPNLSILCFTARGDDFEMSKLN